MGAEDISEKTSIVTGETFSGRMKAADEAPPALMILVGPQGYVGKQFPLTNSEYIVGRATECTIHLDDRSVSRNHARLMIVGPDVTISDLGSANKTKVNDTVLVPMVPCRLNNNDRIQVGNVIFKYLEKGSLETVANKELNEKADKDALTGANSRRALEERGPELMRRAETLNENLSVIVFDIDFFKKINDKYGHAAGDYVLRELGQVVATRVTRSQDFFARFGGEEFVIILVGAPVKPASEVAERIRIAIEAHNFVFEGAKIPVTISCGVAARMGDENVWESLFKRADDALYQSKQNGRNRVTVAS